MTLTIPKITWETAFANTLIFNGFVDSPLDWSEKGTAYQTIATVAGEEDAWSPVVIQFFASFTARHIPPDDLVTPIPATGWNGATGWDAFLDWARDKNEFRFFPDQDAGGFITSFLVEPMREAPSLEVNRFKRVNMIIRNYTTAYALP